MKNAKHIILVQSKKNKIVYQTIFEAFLFAVADVPCYLYIRICLIHAVMG